MLRDILSLIVVLCFSYTGQVLMKKGATEIGVMNLEMFHAAPFMVFKSIFLNVKVILGFFCAGIGAIIYLFVLSRMDLTIAMPILGALGFVVLPLIGWVFLHEPSNIGRVIGTLVIAVGMIIVALS